MSEDLFSLSKVVFIGKDLNNCCYHNPFCPPFQYYEENGGCSSCEQKEYCCRYIHKCKPWQCSVLPSKDKPMTVDAYLESLEKAVQ